MDKYGSGNKTAHNTTDIHQLQQNGHGYWIVMKMARVQVSPWNGLDHSREDLHCDYLLLIGDLADSELRVFRQINFKEDLK